MVVDIFVAIGLAVGAVTTLLTVVRAVRGWFARGGKKSQAKSEPPPDWQKYGHPIFPLVEIKAGLHKPPPGFFWELGRVISESGESFATLRLVDYETSTTVGEKSVSLDNLNGKSWALTYDPPRDEWDSMLYSADRQKARDRRKVSLARTTLVVPMTEWSRLAYTKHSSEAGAMVDTEVIA